MSLLLVPATRINLEKSIEKSVDIVFAQNFFSSVFLDEILRLSGIEGIRCWATTKNRATIFEAISNGDEVLLTEKGTGLFTYYGIIIGKKQNVEFGNALWPIVGESPWEYIYFLANTTRVSIDKKKLVTKLGYADNFAVPGVIKVDDNRYQNFGTISKAFDIPVFDRIAEIDEKKDFSGEDIWTQGKRRIGHRKFSKKIKSNYNYSCAICGITEIEFLIAAHISPWSSDQENRLNPQNGICLCAFHDKAFEYGYIGLSDDFRVLLNPRINRSSNLYFLLKRFEGKVIELPSENIPSILFLHKHRKKHNIL